MGNVLTMTATEANRKFSAVLREVSRGAKITITSHGKEIAVISSPDKADGERAKRLKALAALKAHWATITPVTVGPWTREELYERD
jgi:prevent-host-death family protein